MKKLCIMLLLASCQPKLENDPTFKVGDMVEHKTGGPQMLVLEVSGKHVQCSYMDAAYAIGRERKVVVFTVIELIKNE